MAVLLYAVGVSEFNVGSLKVVISGCVVNLYSFFVKYLLTHFRCHVGAVSCCHANGEPIFGFKFWSLGSQSLFTISNSS